MYSRFVINTLLVLSSGVAGAAGLEFRGNMLQVLDETPDRNTGLDKIYIIYDTANVDMIYTPETPGNVRILKYSNLGGGFAEDVSTISENGKIIVKNIGGNLGYIIEDGDKRFYYWIVDYLPYRFNIRSVSQSSEEDCDATILDVDGEGLPIHYFTINGQQRVLDREITVKYTTQEWDEDNKEFVKVDTKKYFESLNDKLRIIPPAYCYTSFVVAGDKFLQQWNWLAEAETNVIPPVGVMVMTEAIQEGKNNDESIEEDNTSEGSNQIGTDDSGLGGSAPAIISFIAVGTEGVIHNEWQLTKDPNFEQIDYRFIQKDIDYTFTEEGTFYMRYVGSNSNGTCDATGDVYSITIGASELKCPNAFSPDGDGVNDIWKVSYRSLLDFKCWIFDKFGNQIYYFEDPSSGWDGKKGGKFVNPGVYFYVIQATGGDNKKYKKSGDINILRHRSVSSGTVESE